MALIGGNHLELLTTGAEFFPALHAAIVSATRDILLETYIFEPDRTGQEIAVALAAAARRGVRVRVTVDGFGSRPFLASLHAELLDAGVEVRVYRPELRLLSLRRHRLRRLHRKLACIDGSTAFVGGINIIDDFNPDLAYPRHDYAVQLAGPLVASVLRSMERLWLLVSWASLQSRDNLSSPGAECLPAVGRTRARFLIRDNLGHRRDIEDAYLRAINHARREILIANAYFLPGRRFRHALVNAASRGVRVTLLLQGLTEHWLLLHATRALYPHFLAHGIEIHEYRRSYLHAKVAVVDEHWATVGSSNIDPFSLLLAREANVAVYDRTFSATLKTRLLHAIHEGAVRLAREDWRPQGRRLHRAVEWGAYLVVRILIGLAGFGGKH